MDGVPLREPNENAGEEGRGTSSGVVEERVLELSRTGGVVTVVMVLPRSR